MADDEIMEEGGSLVGADDETMAEQRLFDEIPRQRQFDEAIQVLLERGHHALVRRVFLILEQRELSEAMRVLNTGDEDEGHGGGGGGSAAAADPALGEFRRLLNQHAMEFHSAGYTDAQIFRVLPTLVLVAARRTAGFRDHVSRIHGEGGGGAQQRVFQTPRVQDLFDEAMRVLHEIGQRVLLCLELRHDYLQAMRVVDDDGMADGLADEFRGLLRSHVLSILFVGHEEHFVSDLFHLLVLSAIREAAGFADHVHEMEMEMESYSNGGGFGAVPAPAGAVARLEKRRFDAGAAAAEGDCSICFEGFVDGEEVSVMPCPLRGHEFHTNCITKWLGISNVCPLCRHGLAVTVGAPALSTPTLAEAGQPLVEETMAPRRSEPTVERRRRSTRQRRPNVRTSGPEWVRSSRFASV